MTATPRSGRSGSAGCGRRWRPTGLTTCSRSPRPGDGRTCGTSPTPRPRAPRRSRWSPQPATPRPATSPPSAPGPPTCTASAPAAGSAIPRHSTRTRRWPSPSGCAPPPRRGWAVGGAPYELLPQLLASELKAALPTTEIVSATGLMDDIRLVKSDWEIDRMRQVDGAVAAGWQAFVDVLEPGLPEYAIVAAVEAAIKEHGAEDNFMLIASGGDEVRGMTAPSPRVLAAGDMVRTELTPQLDGYWLQICRSATVGKASDAQHRSFDLFNEAVDAGIAAVYPGVTAHDIAKAQNDVFRARGYGQYCTSAYTRVRGHGHGLHLDETPIIEGNETVLPENAVFIIHPNTYTPIAGYHVLGDPVRVTPAGAEILITTERKLFEGGT